MANESKKHIIDAESRPLGRLASEISQILRGKGNVNFAPNKISEDFVVVKNIGKVLFTGKKKENKSYFSHSGYPKGEKTTPMSEVFAKRPDEVLRRAVLGMLPHNKLSQQIIKKLKFDRDGKES